ncbi:uncharacterized protein LOC127853668 [Dreissena polymorpha]|uniref:Uncharacterized protein n=1 Tax=Dreissena polymorpha TaxID=45954 RepID=A0A9D4CK63_DREPO|nr:uncharacterized protein LOC127853668 [Dreissena polymorpha]KAH3726407.1 hypothetical protein DPMN_052274 [Dreissena polymorpha]
MRLFQAQNFYGDTSAPPPPPPFSIDREVTRVMPVYLNQYRDGRRLPTPEKVAVLELSNSFERRRLGKHQRILNDISERCRAQEIDDLSNKLSAKVNLHQAGKPKEMTLYNTTFMGSRLMSKSPPHGIPPFDTADIMNEPEIPFKPNIFEKNYKQFPARRVMRQQTKFEFLRQPTQFPKVKPTQWPKSSSSDSKVHSIRATLAKRQQINGPIQLDHYISPRPDLAPLVLPSIERFHVSAPLESIERSDTCFSTSRMVLGKRSRTQLTMNSSRQPEHRPHEPINLASFGHEYSQLPLTNGHSPPPNSIHELDPPPTLDRLNNTE